MNLELISKVRAYCKSLINNSKCKELPFHNWQHTEDVAIQTALISSFENLKDSEAEDLIIASYFHDTGNIEDVCNHEHFSCEFAASFLANEDFPEHRIKNVVSAIKATKMPQQPVSKLQQIICDADLAHLGKANFITKNLKLRFEWETCNNIKFTDVEWADLNIKFLEGHKFHTPFAQRNFTVQKSKNIDSLKTMLAQA
ncbi:HD domain-containing protein [Croceibacter atlanticus]|uniref:HD domain-containing protein n=1 Tax=Croceibacter atlanticus TaxID=313588 RepID=UPI0030F746ED